MALVRPSRSSHRTPNTLHILPLSLLACAALALLPLLLLLLTPPPSVRAQSKPATASTPTPPPPQEEEQRQPRRVFTGPDSRAARQPALRNETAAPPPASHTRAPQRDEDEGDIERVDTDLTNILLTAIDREKRFFTALKREDIRVLENNEPQQVLTFERETDLPLSLAILVDTSASQERVLPDEQTAARAFIDSVIRPDRDSAAIVSFNGEATPEQSLTNDVAKLHAAINRVKMELPPDDPECKQDKTLEEDGRCWTGAWDAVWATINEILAHTPERTRRAIIFLSDGDDTSSLTKKREAIDFAIKHNTTIYAIGIHDNDFPDAKLDRDSLRKISEQTGGRAFFPADRAELDAAFAQINQELRAQYLIAYSPSNKRRDGTFRQIKIEITNPALRKEKLRLLYRQGYYARGAETIAPAAKK